MVSPSLVNTLLRWYSTVRGLMKSSLPISGLVCPSAASRAICASCGVRSACVDSGALAGCLAGCEELATGALGEGLGAHAVEHVVGGSQLLAGVEPSLFASQPLAVQQVSPGEMHDDPAAPQPLDRLEVERVGSLAGGEQRA